MNSSFSHADMLPAGTEWAMVATSDDDSVITFGEHEKWFETSSSIKSPIGFVALHHALETGVSPTEELIEITEETHGSNGSGTLKHRLETEGSIHMTLDELLESNIVDSDCVATNALIEFCGGKDEVNKLFLEHGVSSIELLMDRINFDSVDHAETNFQLGKAQPHGLANYYQQLSDVSAQDPLFQRLLTMHGDVQLSRLFGLYRDNLAPDIAQGWQNKTGSMFDFTEGTASVRLIDAGRLATQSSNWNIAFMSRIVDSSGLIQTQRDFCEPIARTNIAALEYEGILSTGQVVPFQQLAAANA